MYTRVTLLHGYHGNVLTDLRGEDVDLVDLDMECFEASAFVESLGHGSDVIVPQHKLGNDKRETKLINRTKTK